MGEVTTIGAPLLCGAHRPLPLLLLFQSDPGNLVATLGREVIQVTYITGVNYWIQILQPPVKRQMFGHCTHHPYKLATYQAKASIDQ